MLRELIRRRPEELDEKDLIVRDWAQKAHDRGLPLGDEILELMGK